MLQTERYSKPNGFHLPEIAIRREEAPAPRLTFVTRVLGIEDDTPKTWRDFARLGMEGFVGLFILDVSWRLMDIWIDLVCDHVKWLAWLNQ